MRRASSILSGVLTALVLLGASSLLVASTAPGRWPTTSGAAALSGAGPGGMLAEKYREKTGGDQGPIGTGSETAISYNSPDTGNGFLFPGANGVRDYTVFYSINFAKTVSTGNDMYRVYVGTNGTIADTIVYETGARTNVNSAQELGTSFGVKVLNPSASDLVTVGIIPNGNTTIIKGNACGVAPPNSCVFSTLLIREVP